MGALPAPLAPLAAQPGTAALFLDFDGTLAPIVADPTAARPLPGVAPLLARLARTLSLVAVVSGRPVAFLAGALGEVEGVHLAGLYGLEELAGDGEVRRAPGAAEWEPVVAQVVREGLERAPAGIYVEPKGLTVTLHWRRRPDQAGWVEAFAAAQVAAHGLVPHPGRMEIELRPPLVVDKGTVVRRLAPGHRSAACFGDDVGDLPAFAALGELAAEGMAVARVAAVDPESPPEVAAAADVVVEGPAGALALLGQLADEAAAGGGPG